MAARLLQNLLFHVSAVEAGNELFLDFSEAARVYRMLLPHFLTADFFYLQTDASSEAAELLLILAFLVAAPVQLRRFVSRFPAVNSLHPHRFPQSEMVKY